MLHLRGCLLELEVGLDVELGIVGGAVLRVDGWVGFEVVRSAYVPSEALERTADAWREPWGSDAEVEAESEQRLGTGRGTSGGWQVVVQAEVGGLVGEHQSGRHASHSAMLVLPEGEVRVGNKAELPLQPLGVTAQALGPGVGGGLIPAPAPA